MSIGLSGLPVRREVNKVLLISLQFFLVVTSGGGGGTTSKNPKCGDILLHHGYPSAYCTEQQQASRPDAKFKLGLKSTSLQKMSVGMLEYCVENACFEGG